MDKNMQNSTVYNLTNLSLNPETAKDTDFCIETVGEVTEMDIPASMEIQSYMNPSKRYKIIGTRMSD